MLYQGAAFTANHIFYSVGFCMVMHDAYVEVYVKDWNFLRCSTCFSCENARKFGNWI